MGAEGAPFSMSGSAWWCRSFQEPPSLRKTCVARNSRLSGARPPGCAPSYRSIATVKAMSPLTTTLRYSLFTLAFRSLYWAATQS